MIGIYIGVLIMLSVLFILGQLKRRKGGEHKTNIFQSAAMLICEKWFLKRKMRSALREGFHALYHKHNRDKKYYEFMVQKWEIIIKLILIGSLISLVLSIQAVTKSNLMDGNIIERNKMGKGKKEISLVANVEGIEGEVVLSIEEQAYKTEDLENLCMEMLSVLDIVVLGENESSDRVETDLQLVSKVDGFPFQIEWEIENYNRIGQMGEVHNETLDEKELVQLTAKISHQEYKQEYMFSVFIYPKQLSKDELFFRNLKEKIVKEEVDSRESGQYMLPEEVNQTQINWREKKKDTSIVLFLLCLSAATLVSIGKEKELIKQVDERNRQLMKSYPDIVSKLTLLIGAGMTLQGAIGKLVSDYDKRRKKSSFVEYAYEEFWVLSNEIKMGMSETNAYMQLGKRCKLQNYKKLSTLLVQSLKKGTGNLLMQLENETKIALEERKANAKKKGEEAGTKMLAPMMLMLFIVMIIIIVPAFGSFSM